MIIDAPTVLEAVVEGRACDTTYCFADGAHHHNVDGHAVCDIASCTATGTHHHLLECQGDTNPTGQVDCDGRDPIYDSPICCQLGSLVGPRDH